MPEWKNISFDYIHLNDDIITAIRSDNKNIVMYGINVSTPKTGTTTTRSIYRILNEINNSMDVLDPFIKTIYYSSNSNRDLTKFENDVLFVLTQSGSLRIYGDETNILRKYGISLSESEYQLTPWKKVTSGSIYYYTTKDEDLKFKDFTVTGGLWSDDFEPTRDAPNISISCVLEQGNSDQFEGETWCFSYSFFGASQVKRQIGYYGEANCCYTAGR